MRSSWTSPAFTASNATFIRPAKTSLTVSPWRVKALQLPDWIRQGTDGSMASMAEAVGSVHWQHGCILGRLPSLVKKLIAQHTPASPLRYDSHALRVLCFFFFCRGDPAPRRSSRGASGLRARAQPCNGTASVQCGDSRDPGGKEVTFHGLPGVDSPARGNLRPCSLSGNAAPNTKASGKLAAHRWRRRHLLRGCGWSCCARSARGESPPAPQSESPLCRVMCPTRHRWDGRRRPSPLKRVMPRSAVSADTSFMNCRKSLRL
jgi:hypothetical protein